MAQRVRIGCSSGSRRPSVDANHLLRELQVTPKAHDCFAGKTTALKTLLTLELFLYRDRSESLSIFMRMRHAFISNSYAD